MSVFSNPAVQKQISLYHQQQLSIVLVTGVFDVLHNEHLLFLQKAAQHGDVLVVGVESDTRVRRMKGSGRPVNAQSKRCLQIEALQIAQLVFVLPEKFDDPEDHQLLIESIRPKVLAVSAHTAHQAEKTAILAKIGGQVIVVHEHNPKISTTQMLGGK